MRRCAAASLFLAAALLFACSFAPVAEARIRLPALLSDHMVLQRDSGAVVWGWTDHPGATVSLTVTEADGTKDTQQQQAGKDGAFSFKVGPYPASVGNTLTFSDGDGAGVTLRDVLFGDVLLCAGQSNMEFAVPAAMNATAEIADSINYPNLRMFSVKDNPSLTPLDDVNSTWDKFNWTVSGPGAFEHSAWGTFSAVCFFSGRGLYQMLGGSVPIGMLATDYSGTRAEAWTSPAGLQRCPNPPSPPVPAGAEQAETEEEALVDPSAVPTPSPNGLSVLYNGMVAPLLPMRFRLAIWYQGEANRNDPDNYRCRFPALINDWREQFQSPDLPWFFVQLAPFLQGGLAWAEEQQAQLAALELNGVSFATAFDLGDPLSPETGEHPRYKQQVAARLVRAIAALEYQQDDVVYYGPQPTAFTVAAADPLSVRVQLVDEIESRMLYFQGTNNCGVNVSADIACCKQTPFLVDTAQGLTIRATSVQLADQSLTVSIPSLSAGDSIVRVSYAYDCYPQCALYNSYNLPMTPFNVSVTRAETPRRGHRIALERR